MKKQLVALSLLVVGFQGVAHASFPADAEASYDLAAPETRADRYAGSMENASWGVSQRGVAEHNPFPFGGGYNGD